MKLVFSTEARLDLLRIGDVIAKDNPHRARTFVGELRVRCNALIDQPLAYPVVSRPKMGELRRMVYGRYLIFYQVRSTQIIIIRILPGRMNVSDILGLPE
jgi:plasmid stabilization system protein ParE